MSGRLSIPRSVVETFETAARSVCTAWTGRAEEGSFERVARALGERWTVRRQIDTARSVRLSERGHWLGVDTCYWSARGALVADPELRGARYVEGVAMWEAPIAGRRDVRSLAIEAQGWLEAPDGRVVDLIAAGLDRAAPALRTGVRVVYLPIRRFERAEVEGADLPRLLHTPSESLRTLEALADVLAAAHAEVERCPPATMRRALRVAGAAVLALGWRRGRRQWRPS